jgi:hypothetical protein
MFRDAGSIPAASIKTSQANNCKAGFLLRLWIDLKTSYGQNFSYLNTIGPISRVRWSDKNRKPVDTLSNEPLSYQTQNLRLVTQFGDRMLVYRATELKRTKRGDYRRGLGSTSDGKEVKFALGFDKALAQKRFAVILSLWKSCCARPVAKTADGKPAWDKERLEAARLIARGKRPVVPDQSDLSYQSVVAASRPGAATQHVTETVEQYEAALNRLGRAFVPPVGTNNRPQTGQRLFQAIEAYRTYIGMSWFSVIWKMLERVSE